MILNSNRSQRMRVRMLAKRYGVKRLRLFGSFARGDAKAQSDVDFLVQFERGRSLLDLIGLRQDLEALLKRKVDVVSENGIEYHTPWLIIETKWIGVEKISFSWHDGFRYECLLVDNSQTHIRKWSLPERYPPTPFMGMQYKTVFPLSCFAENWRDSELGQQIKQYAPHLFEKENKQSA